MFADGNETFKITGLNLLSRTVKLENEEGVRFVSLTELKDYQPIRK